MLNCCLLLYFRIRFRSLQKKMLRLKCLTMLVFVFLISSSSVLSTKKVIVKFQGKFQPNIYFTEVQDLTEF